MSDEDPIEYQGCKLCGKVVTTPRKHKDPDDGEPCEGDDWFKYTNRQHNRFCDDMEAAGYEVTHYRGRFYYEGPAVRCRSAWADDYNEPEEGEALAATAVVCQRDDLGLGAIVYPR